MRPRNDCHLLRQLVRQRYRVWRLALVTLLAGCGPSPTDFGRCSGPFPLTVNQSTFLSFAWTPTDSPASAPYGR